MKYCSLDDLKSALGAGLAANLAAGGQPKAEQAIERASSEIDGYLVSGGYEVPLAFTPPNVKGYCIDLAVYNFAAGVGMTGDKAADELREKAKVAREFLRLVGQGKLHIPKAGKDAAGASGEATGGLHKIKVRRGINPVSTRGYF